MNVASRRERIAAQLADLKMPGALEALDEVLSGVDGGGITASEAIERLLATQIALRNSRRLEAAMRSSRLPTIKTLSEFDFSFQPSIKREQIDSLHELGFVARRENIVFLGPPGVGKTHLAISLAIAAAERGRRVYYGTLVDLIDSLEEAKAARRLNHRLKTLTHPALLVVDEIGYLPVSQSGAVLFFQLVNRRYWTASCTGATSSTSAATAIGCAGTPNSPKRSIRRPPERSVPRNRAREGGGHEGTRSGRGSPRGGRSAPFTGAPAMCAIFSGKKCTIFDGH